MKKRYIAPHAVIVELENPQPICSSIVTAQLSLGNEEEEEAPNTAESGSFRSNLWY